MASILATASSSLAGCQPTGILFQSISSSAHSSSGSAMARIEAIEAEYENGQYIDAEDFERELIAQYPWLA